MHKTAEDANFAMIDYFNVSSSNGEYHFQIIKLSCYYGVYIYTLVILEYHIKHIYIYNS